MKNIILLSLFAFTAIFVHAQSNIHGTFDGNIYPKSWEHIYSLPQPKPVHNSMDSIMKSHHIHRDTVNQWSNHVVAHDTYCLLDTVKYQPVRPDITVPYIQGAYNSLMSLTQHQQDSMRLYNAFLAYGQHCTITGTQIDSFYINKWERKIR